MQEWKIGDARIRCLLDVLAEAPPEAVVTEMTATSIESHRDWLVPDYVTGDGKLRIAIQSFLIESQGRRIIVDTCFGNDRQLYDGVPPIRSDYLANLAEAGFPREEVDVILCTHLHHDHVGWNTMLVDGQWVPTFPNATYLVGRREYDHWQDHEDPNIDLRDNLQPVIRAGLHRFVETDHRLTDEVHLEPTPGHTPGHVSVRIDSGGEEALISGDLIHHPVQVVHQEWTAVPDFDSAAAVETRKRVLASIANSTVLLIGTHFNAPSGGLVRVEKGNWSWHPA